jgi:hypothetical protein
VIDGVKDTQSCLAVNRTQLVFGIGRPDDDFLFRHSAGNQTEFPQDLFVGRTFASLNCSMGGIQSGGLVRRDGLVLNRCVQERTRYRVGHDFEQLGNGGELSLIELIE